MCQSTPPLKVNPACTRFLASLRRCMLFHMENAITTHFVTFIHTGSTVLSRRSSGTFSRSSQQRFLVLEQKKKKKMEVHQGEEGMKHKHKVVFILCIPPVYFLFCRKRRNSQSKAPTSTKKRAGTEEERSESEEEEETPDSLVQTASASGSTQRSVIIT